MCVCVYYCAQLSYTTQTQYRTVLIIIFRLILHTVVIAQMTSTRGRVPRAGNERPVVYTRHV